MRTFEIEQFEVHVFKYRVDADDEAQAIVKVLDGEADPVDCGSDYVEIAEDFGLPIDECRELANQLRDLGVPVGEHVIPSIRSISLVDTGNTTSR